MTLALDHLIHAGPDLGRIVAVTTRTAGVAPTPGGRHPGQGTRNALLGLRGAAYLELMAPDPEGRRGDFLASIERLRAPDLHAWCVRTGDADGLARRIEASGVGVVRARAGRDTPAGDRLEWELLFPTGHAWGGAAPFFIDWRGSRHPSEGLGGDVSLRRLALQHPDARELVAWLADLGLPDDLGLPAGLDVAEGPGPALRAELVGRRGPFVLRGAAGGMRPGAASAA